MAEALEEFRNPKGYKEGFDLINARVELQKQELFRQLRNDQHREDRRGALNTDLFRVASLQFKQLLQSMDASHASFLRLMKKDPSIDQDKLDQLFAENYTRQLEKLSLDIEMDTLDTEGYDGSKLERHLEMT